MIIKDIYEITLVCVVYLLPIDTAKTIMKAILSSILLENKNCLGKWSNLTLDQIGPFMTLRPVYSWYTTCNGVRNPSVQFNL